MTPSYIVVKMTTLFIDPNNMILTRTTYPKIDMYTHNYNSIEDIFILLQDTCCYYYYLVIHAFNTVSIEIV